MSDISYPLRIARWLDDRFTDLDLSPSAGTRLYGIEVRDAAAIGVDEAAATSVFIAEGIDLDHVMSLEAASRALDFDAAAVVEHPWLTVDAPLPRPGQFGRKRRGRMVRVITFDGRSATVCRCGNLEVVSADRADDAAA
ncbi:MAG: hypothetical protein WCI22_07970 [Actinomycetota bacterium]